VSSAGFDLLYGSKKKSQFQTVFDAGSCPLEGDGRAAILGGETVRPSFYISAERIGSLIIS
jgi:hypothetical protein